MYCKNCGAQLSDQTKFCRSCGTPTGVGNTTQNNGDAWSQAFSASNASVSSGRMENIIFTVLKSPFFIILAVITAISAIQSLSDISGTQGALGLASGMLGSYMGVDGETIEIILYAVLIAQIMFAAGLVILAISGLSNNKNLAVTGCGFASVASVVYEIFFDLILVYVVYLYIDNDIFEYWEYIPDESKIWMIAIPVVLGLIAYMYKKIRITFSDAKAALASGGTVKEVTVFVPIMMIAMILFLFYILGESNAEMNFEFLMTILSPVSAAVVFLHYRSLVANA